MKSFKQFLKEEITEFNDFWKIIERDCSEILKIYSKINTINSENFLFRGINNDNDFILNKQIRTDRQTIDTPSYVHNIVNKAITDLGFKSHRGNSIFCTNKKYIATRWGKVFIIFPKNGFDYLWFEKQNSTYMYDVWELDIDDTSHKVNEIFINSGDFEDANDFAQKIKKNTKLKNKYDIAHDKAMSKMVKNYKPMNRKLEICLMSENKYDILVSGPPYHAISIEYIREILSKLK